MAGNSERIDDIVDRSAVSGQLKDTTTEVIALEAALADTAKGAALLNNELGRAQTFRQYQQSATQAAASTARLEAEQARLLALNERVIQQQNRTTVTNNQVNVSNARTAQSLQAIQTRTAAASGAYASLERVYRAVNTEARNAGIQFGQNSYQFRELSQQALGLRSRLEATDAPLLNTARNVGGYTRGIAGYFNKAFQGVRTIANILPGLGLSGAFLLIFEGLKFVVEQFVTFNSEASKAKLTLDSFKSALSAGGEYTNAIKNVSELKENIKLAKEGFLDKNAVLKQYNETIGKTTGQVSSLNEAEAELNKNAKDYIRFTFLKATANSALEAAAKKATEAQLAGVQDAFDGGSFAEKVKAGLSGITGLSLFGGFNGAGIAVKAEELKKKRVQSATDEKDKLLKIFEDYQKQASDLATKDKFNFFQDNVVTTPADRRKQLEDRLKEIKEAKDKVINSEQSTFKERIAAVEKFEKDSGAVINKGILNKVLRQKEGANKIAEINNTAREQQEKIQKDLGAYLKAEQDKQLKISQAGLSAELLAFQDAQNQKLVEIDKFEQSMKTALANQYENGKINELQYQQGLLNIEQDTARQRINVQLATAKKVVEAQAAAAALGFGNAKDIQSATDSLTKLQIQSDDLATKVKLDNIEKVKSARQNLASIEREIVNSSIDLIQTLIDKAYTNQSQALDKQSQQISDQADLEKENVDRSLLSAQQKADKNAIIDAQATAQKEVIAEKQKKIQIEAAKIDKAISIGRIAITSAEAVFKLEAGAAALVPGLPFTAGLIAATLAQIPAIIALGAIQAGLVLAAPLPQFAAGGTVGKDGHIITGELGTELRIDPDGKTSLTKDFANVSYARKGTKIVPHMELMGMLKAQDIKYTGGQVVDMTGVIKAIKDNKPVQSKQPVLNGWGREIRGMEKYNNYSKKHFN